MWIEQAEKYGGYEVGTRPFIVFEPRLVSKKA